MSGSTADFSFLRRPAWITLGAVTGVLTLLFINLGLWQLDRLADTRLANAITVQRSAESTPVDLLGLDSLSLSGASDQHDNRRSTLTGQFLPDDEFLIRSQTNNGIAGFHVVTPLEEDSGLVILVNRGWVPLAMNMPPVAAVPPAGAVTIDVVLAGTQERGQFGPEDRPDSVVLSRIDIARIQDQLGYEIAPLYAISTTSQGDLPKLVERPELSEGSHRIYAIQWFAFALISVVGFGSLVRSTESKARRRRDRPESP